jgi:hypothetical protein
MIEIIYLIRISSNREKIQNNAKIRVRYGRNFSTKVRYGSKHEKRSRVSLYSAQIYEKFFSVFINSNTIV